MEETRKALTRQIGSSLKTQLHLTRAGEFLKRHRQFCQTFLAACIRAHVFVSIVHATDHVKRSAEGKRSRNRIVVLTLDA